MSTYTQVRVYCDEEGCEETYNLSSNHGGLNRSWALYMARRDGWAVSRGGDITRCPAHRKRKTPNGGAE
jgi:hypothetical protein